MTGLLLFAVALGQTPPEWVASRASDGHGLLQGQIEIYRPLTQAWTVLLPNTLYGRWHEPVTHHTDNAILITGQVDRVGQSTVTTVLGVAPSGGSAPIAVFSQSGSQVLESILLDEDGAFACAVRDFGPNPPLLHRVDLAGGVTTLIPAVSGLTGECALVDRESGDYLVASWNGVTSTVHRFARRGGGVSVLASMPGRVVGMDHDPVRGHWVLVRLNQDVIAVNPAGQITTLNASLGYPTCLRVDPWTGDIVVGSLMGSLHFLTSLGNPVATTTADQRGVRGIEQLGSRRVSASGPATPGSTVSVKLSFPRAPGQPYVAALSTGLRPGISLGDGRVLSLDWTSPLFAISVGGIPGVTTGFAGTLDGAGRANATVLVLPGVPAGTRLFVSAVALGPALPLGLELGNTWGFTTN